MTLTIDIWLWPLDISPAALDDLARDLPPDAQDRAARFAFPHLRARHVAAHGQMRRILAAQTGQPPRDIVLTTGPRGKPALPGGPAFNLSHSGGWAALALGPATVDLGIDIEAHRPVDDALIARVFSPAERRAHDALAPSDRLPGFFRGWTRKEALLKALGAGLSLPLDAFDVTLSPDQPRLTRIDLPGESPASWHLADLSPGSWLSGALAVRSTTKVTIQHRGTIPPLPPAQRDMARR
jgi:4'-phosphopantetheinyl transferase